MKRKSCTLALLAFIAVILSGSFAVADFWSDLAKGALKGLDDAAKEDAKKKRDAAFMEKINGLLKKIPPEAKVVVMEIKMKAPEFETQESAPDAEESRKKTFKALELEEEKRRDNLEEYIGELGISVVERDAFKEIEKEIVYSQTGEVDPSSSAKFGKAAGATHLIICKTIYDGFKTGHPTAAFNIKIVAIESSKRIGTANFTLDIEQPSSQSIQKQTLVNETFGVRPKNNKVYSWNFNQAGTLEISLNAKPDVSLYVVDSINYEAYAAGRGFRGFAIKERITSANFSVSLPKGLHYIVISNEQEGAGVSLTVAFKPN